MEDTPAPSDAHQVPAETNALVLQARPFGPTLNICDSLVSFYHQERMWVYRTRAELELVLEATPSNSNSSSSSDDDSANSSQTAESETPEGSGRALVLRPRGIKQEPEDPPNLNTTLWMRRKKSYKLKLEGISTRPTKRRRLSPGGSCEQEEPPTPGVRVLELFENMMQSRMESCERVSRLVKEAHMSQPVMVDV
ncbi:hypothetical protein HWV62_18294 [Athelia sp. TMB]|nr:hypothetical protein HWV62_28936 [Athelia sp. TMB]KAF7983914.1 hypothetical protein HWV62_18294 [Athelia sp. TMB]